MIEIRQMSEKDIPSFKETALLSWLDAYETLLPKDIVDGAPKMLDEAIAKRLKEFRLAVEEGVVLGYYSLGEDNYIWHVYVHPAHHRRGIGTMLLKAAEADIAARGHDRAELDVMVGNEKAIAFYLSHGYEEIGREIEDERFGEEIILAKTL